MFWWQEINIDVIENLYSNFPDNLYLFSIIVQY